MKKNFKIACTLFVLTCLSTHVCEAQKKKSEFKLKKNNKSMETYQDDGITSPTHEKYVRKLVFASSPFKNGVDNESEFKNEFTSNEYIYIRAYMPHSINNHPVFAYEKGGSPQKNIYGDYEYKVWIDDANYVFAASSISMDDRGKTVLESTFVSDPSLETRDLRILNVLNGLSEGDHTIKLELHTSSGGFNSQAPVCAGSFVYKKTGATDMKVGKNWSHYQANMRDENLVANMLTAMKDYANREGWNAEIGGVKIVDKAWNIERNEITGIILNRWVATWVYIKYKSGECKVRRFVFEQSHDGSGYSNFLSHNAGGKIEKIDCE